MLAPQPAPMENAFTRHCDRCIAELELMKNVYPEERPCLDKLIKQWRYTKQQLQIRDDA